MRDKQPAVRMKWSAFLLVFLTMVVILFPLACKEKPTATSESPASEETPTQAPTAKPSPGATTPAKPEPEQSPASPYAGTWRGTFTKSFQWYASFEDAERKRLSSGTVSFDLEIILVPYETIPTRLRVTHVKSSHPYFASSGGVTPHKDSQLFLPGDSYYSGRLAIRFPNGVFLDASAEEVTPQRLSSSGEIRTSSGSIIWFASNPTLPFEDPTRDDITMTVTGRTGVSKTYLEKIESSFTLTKVK